MKPYWQDERGGLTIYQGNCLPVLKSLPPESIYCCVTSPPYWGLRDYGTARWEGGDADCDHKKRNARNDGNRIGVDGFAGSLNLDGHADMGAKLYKEQCRKCGARRIDEQLGLERTPKEYVVHLVEVFREVRRVLRSNGTLWLNLGDSYASQGGAHGGRNDNQTGVGAKRTHLAGAGDQAARTVSGPSG